MMRAVACAVSGWTGPHSKARTARRRAVGRIGNRSLADDAVTARDVAGRRRPARVATRSAAPPCRGRPPSRSRSPGRIRSRAPCSAAACSAVSTPSATTSMPSVWARPTIARTISEPLAPLPISLTNERSTLTVLIWSRCRKLSDEKPVPKSSRLQPMPIDARVIQASPAPPGRR